MEPPHSPQQRGARSSGIFAATSDLLAQEERVAQLQTSSLRLEEYQMQLQNVSTQAILLLGFAFALIGTDSLTMVADFSGTFCMFKSPWHFGLTIALFVMTTLAMCMCMLVVFGSAYIIARGQRAYLHIGWLAAVYRTRQSVTFIYKWYAVALLSFVTAVVLLIWVFMALPHYMDADEDFDADYQGDLFEGKATVTTREGGKVLACLDPSIREHRERQVVYGAVLAMVCTLVFVFASAYGYYRFTAWEADWRSDSIDAEWLRLTRQEEQSYNYWYRREREVTRLRKESLHEVAHDGVPDPSIVGVPEGAAIKRARQEATKAQQQWGAALKELKLRSSMERIHRRIGVRTFRHLERTMQNRVDREVRAELQSRGTPPRSSELVDHLSRAEKQVRLEAEVKQNQEAGRNNGGDETAAARARHESVWRADVHRYNSGEF